MSLTPGSAWERSGPSHGLPDAAPHGPGAARAPRGAGTETRSPARQIRVLLVCHQFVLAYRVLRCAKAAGATVTVLGNEGSAGFRYSMFCERFVHSSVQFDGSTGDEIAREINRVAAECGIDVVVPGDAGATRSIIGVRKHLDVKTFDLPDLETFDLLNDKWTFTQLCRQLGILHPRSWLVERHADLAQRLLADVRTFPVVAKPLSLSGSEGVTLIESGEASGIGGRVSYEPIIVQEFIDGIDIGASVYCRAGNVVAWIIHKVRRAIYITFHDDAVLNDIRKVSGHLHLDGIYNFDMRMSADGRVFFLECNPRMYYKIDQSMRAGINFLRFGLGDRGPHGAATIPPGTNVRMPKALVACLPTPWRLTRRDFAMLLHVYSDPVQYARQLLKIDWEPY